MDKLEKTIKLRAYSDNGKSEAKQGNLTEAQHKLLDAAKKDAELVAERARALENVKQIEQLQQSLEQEQARTAEMKKKVGELEVRIENLTAEDANELTLRTAQLEEEKRRALENLKTIVQLRESLKREQEKAAGMAPRLAELDAKVKELAAAETSELAARTSELETERKKSLEQARTIEQLQQKLGQEQARVSTLEARAADQEARLQKLAELEAAAKEMADALGRISTISSAVKPG